MKTAPLFPVLALSLAAGAVALPAAAQHHGPRHSPAYQQVQHGGWQTLNQRKAGLDRRIDLGLRNGRLSRREAASLSGEFAALLRLEANYRRGGLTGWERADLDRRYDRLSAQIRHERRDRDNRRG